MSERRMPIAGQLDGRNSMPRAIRAAAVPYVVLGVSFGVSTAIILDHFARSGELPMSPFGFRSLSGPIEQLGPVSFLTLGWILVGVCALDVLAGVWLWQGPRRGAAVGLATSPGTFVLALGFALPFLLAGVPIRVGLVLANRRSLR